MKDFNDETTVENSSSVFVKIYNKRKSKYINYARKLEYHLSNDKHEANETSKIIERMLNHLVTNYDHDDRYNRNKATRIFHVYFVACFWIVHKYCHDEHISGEDLSRITRISIKDICDAEVDLLFLYKFNIRNWLFNDIP